MVDGNYLDCNVRSIFEADIGTFSNKAKFKLTLLEKSLLTINNLCYNYSRRQLRLGVRELAPAFLFFGGCIVVTAQPSRNQNRAL
jgi:hypothetical protein